MEKNRKQQVAEFYRKGVVSLQEAANAAHVSLYEMMEYVQREQIRPPGQSADEIHKEIEESRGLFEKLKENKSKNKKG